jgi:uncharacterized protein YggE
MKGNIKLLALFLAAVILASAADTSILGDPNTFVLSGTGTTTVKADTALIYVYVE